MPTGELVILGEKIAAASASGRLRLLPWFDPYSEDTPEKKAAYRTMLRSPIVKPAVFGKLFGVASLDLQAQPAGELPGEKLAAEFCQDSIDNSDGGALHVIQSILYGALVDGYSVSEPKTELAQYGRWAGKQVLNKLKAKDTQGLTLIADDFDNVTHVEARRNGRTVRWEAEDFVICQHMALFESPQGTSDLAAAYGSFVKLDTTEKFRIIHLEKFTSPMMVGRYQRNDKAAKNELDTFLAQVKSRTWGTLPEDLVIEAMQIAQRGEAEFAAACKDFKTDIVLAISMAFLQMLEGSTTDARGNSLVQKSTHELAIWYLSSLAANVIGRQLFRILTRLNFQGVAAPKCTLGAVNEADRKAQLEVDEGLQRLGLDISRKDAYKRYGCKPPADPTDVLRPAPVSVPGLPFGNGNGPPLILPSPNGPPQPGRQFAEDSGKDVALGGVDGRKAEELLSEARREGVRLLSLVTEGACRRLLAAGPVQALRNRTLFDGSERDRLTQLLASVRATGDLLGRSRIRERERRALELAGRQRFTDEPTTFRVFADAGAIPGLLTPQAAVNYFKRLEPKLGVDPLRFGPQQERQAFTLAAATELTLLDRVQELIGERLQSGQAFGTAAADIDALLDSAGVTPRSSGYSDMVWRTNAMDSYNSGAVEEMADPEVMDTFPTYFYSNPDDSRSRKTHAARNRRLYDARLPFTIVRGTEIEDVAQCRCTPIPCDKWETAELRAKGVRVYTTPD